MNWRLQGTGDCVTSVCCERGANFHTLHLCLEIEVFGDRGSWGSYRGRASCGAIGCLQSGDGAWDRELGANI